MNILSFEQKFYVLRTCRDLNPGPLAHKRETLRNNLFLSNFTIDFLQEKMKIFSQK